MLIFCWPLSWPVKIDATLFKVNMTNHSQDITKKMFQWRLKVPSHKQILLCNTYIQTKYFTFSEET